VSTEGAAKFNAVMASFLAQVANRQERPAWYDKSFFRRYALSQ
jgi:hypothetical protein